MDRQKRGRTRLVVTKIDGQALEVTCAGVFTQHESVSEQRRLQRLLPDDGSVDVCLLDTEDRPYWFSSERSKDLFVPLISAASSTGTLQLSLLKVSGQSQTCPVALPLSNEDGRWHITLPQGFRSTTPAMAAKAEGDLGLATVASLIPAAERATLVREILAPAGWPRWSKAHRDRGVQYMESRDALKRGLTYLAPQEIPRTLLDRSPLSRAWITPERYRAHVGTQPHWIRAYRLVALTHRGQLVVRTVYDGVAGCLLASALQHAESDGNNDRWARIALAEELPRPNFEDSPREHAFVFCHPQADNGPLELVNEWYNAAYAAVMLDVYEALEPSLRDTFESTHEYNLLQSTSDPERAKSRRQAEASIWGAADLMLSSSKAGQELLATVDARFKLHRAAAKAAKVPLWVIRRMATTPRPVLEALGCTRGGAALAELLLWIGPELKLRSVEEAKEVTGLVDWLAEGFATRSWWKLTLKDHRLIFGIAARSVLRNRKDRKNLVHEAAERGVNDRELGDWWKFLTETLIAAGPRRHGVEDAIKAVRRMRDDLLRDATVEDITRWVVKFHELMVGVRFPEATEARGVPPELWPEQVLPESGWTVRQLRSAQDLHVEGQQMSHCVGSYAGEVSRRTSIVFSLCGPGSTPDRVTVEMSAGDVSGWYLRQMRHEGNQVVQPGSEAARAVDEFISALEAHAAAIDPGIVKTYRRPDPGRRERDLFFIDQMVASFGSRGWTMIRGALPRSNHGRIETKLNEIFLRTCRAMAEKAERTRAHLARYQGIHVAPYPFA